jgi:signal transduction histidine kinase
MNQLLDALLELSRITRVELSRARVDVGELARAIAGELARGAAGREVAFEASGELGAHADPVLLRALLEHLIGNAWKFTAHAEHARIEVGREGGVFFVRDNGAGFDMQYAGRLFAPFQRLHGDGEFPGVGIGLAIAARIVERHGGRISIDGAPGRGATVRFTLPEAR